MPSSTRHRCRTALDSELALARSHNSCSAAASARGGRQSATSHVTPRHITSRLPRHASRHHFMPRRLASGRRRGGSDGRRSHGLVPASEAPRFRSERPPPAVTARVTGRTAPAQASTTANNNSGRRPRLAGRRENHIRGVARLTNTHTRTRTSRAHTHKPRASSESTGAKSVNRQQESRHRSPRAPRRRRAAAGA